MTHPRDRQRNRLHRIHQTNEEFVAPRPSAKQQEQERARRRLIAIVGGVVFVLGLAFGAAWLWRTKVRFPVRISLTDPIATPRYPASSIPYIETDSGGPIYDWYGYHQGHDYLLVVYHGDQKISSRTINKRRAGSIVGWRGKWPIHVKQGTDFGVRLFAVMPDDSEVAVSNLLRFDWPPN